jgi:hypothetical protein
MHFFFKNLKQNEYHIKEINEIKNEYPKFVTCFGHPIDFPLEI